MRAQLALRARRLRLGRLMVAPLSGSPERAVADAKVRTYIMRVDLQEGD